MSKKTKKRKEGAPTLSSADLNVKMAWLYHVEGLTQERIASLLDVSRMKVMRALAASAEDHIVVTTINADTADQVALERRLEKRWNLKSAIVVPEPQETRNLERAIGHAVARYLEEQFVDGMTLAIGGGATLHASLAFMARRELKDSSVIGLVGSLPHSQWINPSIVATKVAERLKVDSYQISAPVIVDDPALRDRLWEQASLSDVRQRAAKADMALLTVGEVSADATIFRHGIVPQSLIGPLREKGAVANILCHFVDREGRLVDHEVNRRIMAIDLETVARTPHVILAAGGEQKVAAILAALRTVSAEALITDAATARLLLEEAGEAEG
ncbi:sugar-binding transcriptional regulator [Nitratireductor pacificus]|uniref:DeoR family transcriptional regulator n=1 Tax=Nitratireductor pacificus pht-3B TaxID=391937 RepID=K2N511_9HYPH|nr:sugar-binding domain-containing protein [Nitratireductor pacificus]EKF19288.1 DeoR family transcriptional regulator [Nitratireductor pacificus pht-3B]